MIDTIASQRHATPPQSHTCSSMSFSSRGVGGGILPVEALSGGGGIGVRRRKGFSSESFMDRMTRPKHNFGRMLAAPGRREAGRSGSKCANLDLRSAVTNSIRFHEGHKVKAPTNSIKKNRGNGRGTTSQERGRGSCKRPHKVDHLENPVRNPRERPSQGKRTLRKGVHSGNDRLILTQGDLHFLQRKEDVNALAGLHRQLLESRVELAPRLHTQTCCNSGQRKKMSETLTTISVSRSVGWMRISGRA